MGVLEPVAELRAILFCTSFEEEPGPFFITALLFLDCSCFFIHSLPWLVTVWICPLELGKGLGGWSIFPTNKNYFGGLPLWFSGKESACHAGDPDLIPRSGISFGEGNGNPLQYSCLENSMDGGAWQATVHGVTKNRTWVRTPSNTHTAIWNGPCHAHTHLTGQRMLESPTYLQRGAG